MRRWPIGLATLLVLAGPAAGRPIDGSGGGGERTLAVESLDPAWNDRLTAPLLERLRPIGRYVPARLPAEGIVDRVAADPTTLGLMRRSRLPSDRLKNGAVTFIEIGPAACLALAVAPTAPWLSYAELNYRTPARGLRVRGAGADALEAFLRLGERFPLKAALVRSEQPFRLGLERLLDGEVDVLAFEVIRRGRTPTPPAALVEATERGARLLPMPTHLHAAADRPTVADVPLEDPPFWRAPRGYTTFCDPFVMVFASAFAEDLLVGLDRGPAAEPGTEPARWVFLERIEAAMRSFVAMVRRWV